MPFITSSGCPGPTKCTLRATSGKEMADFKLGDILKNHANVSIQCEVKNIYFFVFLFIYVLLLLQ